MEERSKEKARARENERNRLTMTDRHRLSSPDFEFVKVPNLRPFTSIRMFPDRRCATDYLAVYAGTSTSSPLITTLCGNDQRSIKFKGPNVLVDFR